MSEIEICKLFVIGYTIEKIAERTKLTAKEVKQILSDNTEQIKILKDFYKGLGVI